MNSDPKRKKTGTVTANNNTAAMSVAFQCLIEKRHIGSYTLNSTALTGCFSSG